MEALFATAPTPALAASSALLPLEDRSVTDTAPDASTLAAPLPLATASTPVPYARTSALLPVEPLSVTDTASASSTPTAPAASTSVPAARTSWSCALGRSDPVLARLVERAALLCGLSSGHAEEAQVVRYRHGEEYREHCDYFSLQVRTRTPLSQHHTSI
jgi:hypothetical protein